MKKVLLINMPFFSITNPSIGISLLKSGLSNNGIPCDIKYFNIVLAKMIGTDLYESICEYEQGALAERHFAREYFKEGLPDEKDFFKQDIFANAINTLSDISRLIAPFLERCMDSVCWEDYNVVGFSSMFQQNLASITLAHMIKLHDPQKIIIFGGANCEGKMGLALHRNFPFIDYVCSGEADYTFPELVKRVSNKESARGIAGVIYHENGESRTAQSTQAIRDMDSLPYPDYDDYFTQLKAASLSSSECYNIPMETSRGCWWGQKSQCKFCGLNGGAISFRSKSKNRVIKELVCLMEKYAKRYNIARISMVDNILDTNYFKDLIPLLKKVKLPVELFFEVKSNLSKEQVKMLSEAGITEIQPGIESINTHVLKLMNKGVTALQNIQLLKYCKQYYIYPVWNILTGFPGENLDDYMQMINLINKVTHLPPPGECFPFALHRFSPFFSDPEKYGIINVRPHNHYRFIYPFDESQLSNLVYYFEFDYKDNVKPPDCDRELTEAVNYWQEGYADNEYLHSIKTSLSTLVIKDGRSNAQISRIVLESSQKDIYEYCDRIRSLSSVFSYIREKHGDFAVRERNIKDFLDEMVSLNFMVSEDNKYLSIAVPAENGYAQSRRVSY